MFSPQLLCSHWPAESPDKGNEAGGHGEVADDGVSRQSSVNLEQETESQDKRHPCWKNAKLKEIHILQDKPFIETPDNNFYAFPASFH